MNSHIVEWGTQEGAELAGVKYKTFSTGQMALREISLSKVVGVAAGDNHVLFLDENGKAYASGFNNYNQTIVPSNATNIVAIAAGKNHSLALKCDGSVVAWGNNQEGEINVPSGLSHVSSIAAGWDGSMALKSDGTILAWGNSNKPEGISNVVAIAATSAFYGSNLALKKDGTVFEWCARPGSVEMVTVAGLSNVVAISAGANHSLALLKNGTVFGWGSNNQGQATGNATDVEPYLATGFVKNNGITISNIVSIVAGDEFSLALKRDGTVIGWGNKRLTDNGVIPSLSKVAAISCGHNFCLALITNEVATTNLLLAPAK